jgi:ferredoxin--NADP+ reductase
MQAKILSKTFLNADNTLFEMVVEAPLVAKKARGGNFIMLRLSDVGERFPLTIADYDRKNGTISMVVLAIGKSTKELSTLKVGEYIHDFVGPLGNEAHIQKYEDPVVLVGGGVGIAAIHPQAKEFKEAGNHVISILGARSANLLFWEDKMRAVSDEVIITTDDGSKGEKGLVTDALKKLMNQRKLARCIAIGPLIMMKFVAEATRGKLSTTVSLNPIMVDGTGMCGGCRFQTLSKKMKFACVDGPDVDGHDVDFDNLLQRNARYKPQEKEAMHRYTCKAEIQAEKIEKSGH